MAHNSPIFYNKVTSQVFSYNQLKALFSGISWVTDYKSPSVDNAIADTNPPNGFLATYPTLADWERLYQDPQPEVKLWEITEPGTIAYNGGTSQWEWPWATRSRTAPEMINVYVQVQSILDMLADEKLGGEVEFNGLKADSTKDTQNALNRLITGIMSQADLSAIDWQGLPDTDGIYQWGNAAIEDLQGLAKACFLDEQKAFTAKRQVMADFITTPLDTMIDVTDAFETAYNNL